ncbi:hypothetical protein HC256_009766 [Beauveria bassiana]|nr:hypothetical protein HC256_009766 [Beauveria bassiana]
MSATTRVGTWPFNVSYWTVSRPSPTAGARQGARSVAVPAATHGAPVAFPEADRMRKRFHFRPMQPALLLALRFYLQASRRMEQVPATTPYKKGVQPARNVYRCDANDKWPVKLLWARKCNRGRKGEQLE